MQNIKTYVSANSTLPAAIGVFPVGQIELRHENEPLGENYAALHERREGKVGVVKVEFFGEKHRRLVRIVD